MMPTLSALVALQVVVVTTCGATSNDDVGIIMTRTVKPVSNDHLYDKIYHLWFIQWCVLTKAECTNLLLLTIFAFWS